MRGRSPSRASKTGSNGGQRPRPSPRFAELLAERERRFAPRARDCVRAGYDFHKSALYEAGFREVDTIWQYLDNRVLMAVR